MTLEISGSRRAPIQNGPLYFAALALVILVGLLRIGLGYSKLFQTCDEPYHVGAGLAWLDTADVTDIDHPPLARVAAALPLYIDGLRTPVIPNPPGARPLVLVERRFQEGEVILRSRGTFLRNLTLARAGMLPFFVAASLLVWAWTRRLYGMTAALAAVVLFSSLPPVLAHAGIATTDIAVTTTLFGATYATARWLAKPDWIRGLVMGVASGLAILSKFSTLLFLPACVSVLIVLRLRLGSSEEARPGGWRHALASLSLASVSAFCLIWAGYRFTARPLAEARDRPHRIVRAIGLAPYLARHGRTDRLVNAAIEAPIPAVDMIRALSQLRQYNERGRLAYFMGKFSDNGVWYFFPVLLAIKTPLAFWLLVGIGSFELLWHPKVPRQWEHFAPLFCSFAIVATALPANLNIGLRHVLPVYPFLSMVAGLGFARLVRPRSNHWATRLVGALLMTWHLSAGAFAHPDYLSYFNALAGAHPERIVIDSDLDWGQDLWRLRDTLRALSVTDVALGFFWTQRVDGQGLPRVRKLTPYQREQGWVAITEFTLKTHGERLRRLMRRTEGAFDWLEPYPFVRVGHTIRLYHIRS